MRVPLEWLKTFVTIRLPPTQLAERLTMAGLEVTAIDSIDGEPVFDVEITPNRADWLSVIGVAREVAALTGQHLKCPTGTSDRSPKTLAKGKREAKPRVVQIRIEDREGCPRYIGRLIDGVKIGPSPEWMQRRLVACGARPINNVVDITNYVLFEYGQPLHAFDFARLVEGTIIVRRAHSKEPIATLDGVRRVLTPEMLVIADAQRPIAVAGVMGGMGSEVTSATTAILLESALFDPIIVRRTARALGLASDSSYRFERGVDPEGVEMASRRAAQLLHDLAHGTDVTMCDVGAKPTKRTVIIIETTQINRLLGTKLSPATVRTSLAQLSCRVASSGAGATLRVTVPSFRRDLKQAVDVAEEIARIIGYDRVPPTVPAASLQLPAPTTGSTSGHLQSLRCVCASFGLTETVTWSLVSESDLARYRIPSDQAVRLINPLSQDHAYVRPTLVMGLLQTVRRNMTQGASGVRVFEVGHVIPPRTSSRSYGSEQISMGIALCGLWSRDWQTCVPVDFFRLKGIVTALSSRLCHETIECVAAAPSWVEPGQGADLLLNGRVVGSAGQIAAPITQGLDLEQPVWFAECSVDALLANRRTQATAATPTTVPSVKRDLSFMVDQTIPFSELYRTICQVSGELAGNVQLIDRYIGKQIPQGQASLTFSIDYHDPGRTLTAAEVDTVHQRIKDTLVSTFRATLR